MCVQRYWDFSVSMNGLSLPECCSLVFRQTSQQWCELPENTWTFIDEDNKTIGTLFSFLTKFNSVFRILNRILSGTCNWKEALSNTLSWNELPHTVKIEIVFSKHNFLIYFHWNTHLMCPVLHLFCSRWGGERTHSFNDVSQLLPKIMSISWKQGLVSSHVFV